jgi:CRP-like cAMP-binding protein
VTDDGSQQKILNGEELGWRPFVENRPAKMTATSDCGLICIEATAYQQLLMTTPQLNYQTRKRLIANGEDSIDWLLGEVAIY